MQIGNVAARRASRIDDDDPGSMGCFGRRQTLVQHGMTPGGVAADEHDEIGEIDVVVASRDDVLAEGADMARHRRGHAEPRIGIDVAAAYEALHQFVGDVIILGKELAGDVERHSIGPIFRDRAGKAGGDAVERLVPAHRSAVDFRPQQPVRQRKALAEGGALGTQPAAIGRVIGVTRNRAVGFDPKAATDTAIRAGRADRGARHRDRAHAAADCWTKTIGSAAASRPKTRPSRKPATPRLA